MLFRMAGGMVPLLRGRLGIQKDLDYLGFVGKMDHKVLPP